MEIIKLRGVLVDILCKISSDYKAYVTRYKRGFNQLLLNFHNALNGTMVAMRINYRNFTNSISTIGFEINPYNPCVAKKVIGGSQMTIFFDVDD